MKTVKICRWSERNSNDEQSNFENQKNLKDVINTYRLKQKKDDDSNIASSDSPFGVWKNCDSIVATEQFGVRR